MPFILLVALACCTLVLNLSGFMTVAAVLPTLIAEWSLSSTEAGWLGGAFFAGYVLSVPVLMALTDRIASKRIYIAAAMVGTLASIGFGIFADGLWSGIAYRFLNGIGVGGTYMPALKALADHFEEPRRTRVATYYTSMFAVGTAASVLASGEMAAAFGWRWAFAYAATGSFGALVLGWAVLPAGRTAPAGTTRRVLDVRPVFRNRAAMVNIVAYFGHTWEVFGSRVWMVTFLVIAAASHPGETYGMSPIMLAALVSVAGMPASIIVGEIARRHDRRMVLLTVMVISAAVSASVGFAMAAPLWLVATLAVMHGMMCYADTGTINTVTVTVAGPDLRGATLAVHAFIGFLGGVLGPLAVGAALDLSGGIDSAYAWGIAFCVIGSGSVFAAAVLVVWGRR
jgi:MFS family permease